MERPLRHDDALLLSDEHLSRLLEPSAQAELRSSTGSLDSWHWGSLRSGRGAAEQRRPGAGRDGSPAARPTPDFRQSAVVQSGAYLPQAEGASPGRGLDTIATSPLSATLRRARLLTLTSQARCRVGCPSHAARWPHH